MEKHDTAALCTVRPDGRPHVAPIWFVLDGDDLIFTTGVDPSRVVIVRRDPRGMLTVDREEPRLTSCRLKEPRLCPRISTSYLLGSPESPLATWAMI